MIQEDEKKQQPEVQEQQTVTHQDNFTRPEVEEEALMQVIAGEEPAETERTKSFSNHYKKNDFKAKKVDQRRLLRTVL